MPDRSHWSPQARVSSRFHPTSLCINQNDETVRPSQRAIDRKVSIVRPGFRSSYMNAEALR